MFTKEKYCSICRQAFEPHPKTRHNRGYRQRACSKPGCQRERKRRYWRRLMASRPKSLKRHLERTRLWAQAGGYWKDWRTDNEEYVAKDNERRRQARLMDKRAAKQVQIKHGRAERIRHLRQMIVAAQSAAKQVQLLPMITGLVDYLDERDGAAKQVHMDLAGAGAG
jgi:hypothetical protein